MATFAPANFLERLKVGSLTDPANPTLVGIIQPDAGDVTGFLFSAAPSGEVWLPIAADLIESIDHLGTVPHGEHGYPCVRLTLKPAGSENASIQRLLSQKAGTMAAEARSIGTSLQAQAGPSNAARGRCIIYQGMEGLYVCCPPPPGSGGPYVCTGMV